MHKIKENNNYLSELQVSPLWSYKTDNVYNVGFICNNSFYLNNNK